MSDCGLSLMSEAVRPRRRAARAVSSAAWLMRGSVTRPKRSAAPASDLAPAVISSSAPPSACSVRMAWLTSLAAVAALLPAWRSACRVCCVSCTSGGTPASAGSRRVVTVLSRRRASWSMLPAASPNCFSAVEKRCWFSSPSRVLMRCVASCTWPRMAGPCSASWLNEELCSGRRGRPLAPGGGAGSGASASSSCTWARPVTPW